MSTIEQFVKDNKIGIKCEQLYENPHMPDFEGYHYKVRLRHAGKSMSCYFSMGLAHVEEPKASDVLNCLSSDSAGVEQARDFDDWCANYGYDTDSRKARRTYRACERQREKLQKFLGDLYEELLYHTELL